MDNRPHGRQKYTGGQGKDVGRRGDGLGTGPVGNGGRPSGGSGGNGGPKRSGDVSRGILGSLLGNKKVLIVVVVIVILLLIFGGKGLFSGLFSGGNIGGFSAPAAFSGSSESGSWTSDSNTGRLNTSVDPAARAKYTSVKGGGSDSVTVMVYMCGTDLESKNGMGTADLGEMCAATLSDKVNLLVYTGGCQKWKTPGISSTTNQIYKVEGGKLHCLVENDGAKAMTDPATLTHYITWAHDHYPADRNILIFWDHGGGSLSGYGYDEKNSAKGSMTLSRINVALADAFRSTKTYFDFIGFDACLMATLETGLTLSPYTDYMVGSEETEPGIGWYYTDWLNALSQNTSMSTLEIGKNIADSFVEMCNKKCAGQGTTLSVVDLAELEMTVPEKFRNFAMATSDQISADFQKVADARSTSREFAKSSKIDQVDLVHFAQKLGTAEAKALANTLLSAVKYNRTSSTMTNSYGLSIYFPYQKTSQVNSAVSAYNAIGLEDEYADCIRQFASLEVGGQAVAGGASSPLGSLLGQGAAPQIGSDMISSLLGGLLGGNLGNVAGLTSENSGFLSGFLDVNKATPYLTENRFDTSALVWKDRNGTPVLTLSDKQWGMVKDLELNVYLDDGEGYIDLGCDNVFDFAEDGALIGTYDGTWIAINNQPVAYYMTDNYYEDDAHWAVTGRVPVLLNDVRADLILVFDPAHPEGYVAGARTDYRKGETDTVAKALTDLQNGDEIDFLCDYYAYDGTYQDSYKFGDQMVWNGTAVIRNVTLAHPEKASATYRFTDIYCQTYWTEVIPG